jgi:hypothetical protein
MSLSGNNEEFILMNTLHLARKVWALVVVPSNMVGSACDNIAPFSPYYKLPMFLTLTPMIPMTQ